MSLHVLKVVYHGFWCGLFNYQQRAYGVDPDSNDERVCLAQWNNCGYTISSLGMCGVSVSF